jgi:multimeric flavodoxin WrbA
MSKKIVILNGSPRPKGNTSALVEECKRGAEEAGCTVTAFVLDKMDIHGCKGCSCGGKNPDSPCVQKDDMCKIYPVYREANVVVLASPLYYWNLSGQLRTAFDRLFAVAECDSNYANPKKDSVLIMVAEGYGFDDALGYYQNLMKHLGWKELGHMLAGGVMKVGDINGHKELKEAYELGKSVAPENGL